MAVDPGTGHTDVATANMLRDLGSREAEAALAVVLAVEPDLVGLQEWGPSRVRMLLSTGQVRPANRLASRWVTSARTGYLWLVPAAGGCPVGARAERYALVEARTHLLGGVGPSDPGARPLPVAPARFATVAVLHDRWSGTVVSVLSFHLTPGVQVRGRYREDRPRLVTRHQGEVERLGRLVSGELDRGRVVYAVGDSNFDGLRLPGLISSWEGREPGPGTLGPHRRVDDVHGPGPASTVTLLSTGSDHRAMVARRPLG